MGTGWEQILADRLVQVFGSQEIVGLIAIMMTTILIVALRPPTAVAFTAVALIILIFGGYLVAGQIGFLPMLWVGIAIGLALLIYYAWKRVGGQY